MTSATHVSESTTPTIRDEPGVASPVDPLGGGVNADITPQDDKTTKLSKEQDASSQSDSDVLIVNWEGPDDPQNPKKYVIPTTVLATDHSLTFCGR